VYLLTIDLINNRSDTCQVLIQLSDSLNVCSNSNNQYSINGSATNSLSCNTCDGFYQINSITFNNGQNTAVPPYLYLWNNQSTAGPTITGLCPYTQYNVSIVDANGNLYQQDVSLGCNGGPSNCYNANLIDSSIFCPPVLSPVCGCNGVSYSNACVAQYENGIFNYSQGVCQDSLLLDVSVSSATYCDSSLNPCNGQIILNVSGPNPSINYTWMDSSMIGPVQSNVCPGNYIVTISDSNGNSITRIITVGTIGCVWPGDTDDNSVANNLDLLAVGLAYNDNGTPRNSINTSWGPISSADWQVAPINGLPNHKYIDCDGNGTIDSLDVSIIDQNYGQSYVKSVSNSLWSPQPFYVESTSASPGDSLQLDIFMGDSSNTYINAYAVAFTVEYDTALVNPNSVDIQFDSSWLGNDLLDIQKNFSQNGAVEVAVSRKNKQGMDGFGRIGSVNFTIKDDVMIGKINNPNNNLLLPIALGGIRIVNNNNIELGSNPQTAIVQISLLSSTQLSQEKRGIECFPNPAKKQVFLRAKEQPILAVRLYAIDGRCLYHIDSLSTNHYNLSLKNYAAGIYLLEVRSELGLQQTRLIIQE
jgi:hypothetical protein